MPRFALGRLSTLPRAVAAQQTARAALPAVTGVRALHLTAPKRAAATPAPTQTPPVAGGPIAGQDMMTGETTGGQDIDVSERQMTRESNATTTTSRRHSLEARRDTMGNDQAIVIQLKDGPVRVGVSPRLSASDHTTSLARFDHRTKKPTRELFLS